MSHAPPDASPLSPTAEQLRGWGLDPSWSRRVTFTAPSGEVVDLSSSYAGPAWQGPVHAALVGLGWSTREAEAAVAAVAPGFGADAAVGDVLKAALRSLDRA